MSNTQPIILFLEDDQGTRESVKMSLALAGIRVHSTANCGEAWEFAVANWFDLYLLGGTLPDGDCFKLCADLRELSPEKPILFYSKLVLPKDMQRAFDAGASAFLKKPFDGDLGVEVNDLLRTGKHTAPTSEQGH